MDHRFAPRAWSRPYQVIDGSKIPALLTDASMQHIKYTLDILVKGEMGAAIL